ncbi:MAG: ATP-dependent RNA helicase DbpA [Pelotomaculum sp. PtaB.Bin013]|uniref:DEAD/DEAH box helicase n=1 Tax=Pelotomaculum isophthalicicum JI TaxID=947010 RepID=A0A9X4JT65_9FIRM|nr:DEAD/DEAH box helicase [Pelotomaculum isophthalicicum]MDF9408229.1 DEAD/DEAH box helicase [Pelotomaculum isophthalicicum JI]OPX92116.1 MAG: ATP-dependent RNA helicase DbpA [Pelotomaculum sp. PtaB.Bin013]
MTGHRMEVSESIEMLLRQSGFSIEHEHIQAPRDGRYLNCPELHPKILAYVQSKFQGKLYLHQALGIDAALRGENVVLATGTASGKTISFALPVFNELLTEQNSRALFFYPTKALAGDQLKALQDMAASFGLGDKIYRFDGDVDTEGRKKALQKGRILLCTPDVLHTTMLKRNNEREYSTFFQNLKYVILDECHIYSGAFGSNMAFVMRRLRQVCRRKGSEYQILAASATSRDPGRHMELLTSLKFTVIDEKENGTPSVGRRFIFTGIADDSEVGKAGDLNHLIATLTEGNLRFIAFCYSRRLTEQYYNELTLAYPALQSKVMPYRSGYEVEDRQKIENTLRDGKLCGVISTSALELGVDLPNMEYCLLIGLPSTAMSFWQRVGRVGRSSGSQGKVLIFPSDNSIDDYYRSHPGKLYERPLEELALHLDNRQLILSHYSCARVESGNFDNPELAADIFGQDFVELEEKINNIDIVDDILTSNDPHNLFGIRGIDDPTYEIFTTGGDKRLGTITWSQILREAYPQAVYRHMGEAYRVDRILNRDYIIKVKREKKSAGTSPAGYVTVKEKALGGTIFRKAVWPEMLEMYHSTVAVITRTTGYKERINNKWVQTKYPSPLQRRVITEGVWLKFLPRFGECRRNGLNAFAHAVSNLYTIHNSCDSADIATHAVIKKLDNYAVIYFFDITSGGLGISAGLFDVFLDLLQPVEERLLKCDHCDPESFDRGCPACIQVPRWFEDNEHLSKEEALSILYRIKDLCKQTSPQISISSSYQHRSMGGFTSISDLADEMSADDMIERYGRILFQPGAIVAMRSGAEGTVVKYFEDGGDIFYHLEMENGKVLRVKDMGLRLIKGDQRYLCINCGNEDVNRDLLCPQCGVELF